MSRLVRFDDDHPALIEAESGRVLTYAELSARLPAGASTAKRLVLHRLEPRIESVVAYLADLAAGHAVVVGDRRSEPALSAAYFSSDKRPALHRDLSLLLTTSGSTGSAKVVRLSALNVESNAAAIAESLSIDRSDRAVTSLPLSYSYGLSVLHSHLWAGASVVLSEASVVQPDFWQVIGRWSVTSLAGVPYTYQVLSRLGALVEGSPSLSVMTQAGGRLAPGLVARFHETMAVRGGRFHVMYGQTEASPRMTCLPAGSLPGKLGSVGVPLPGGSVEIDNGEVVYRGPNVMMGYARAPGDLARGDDCGGVLRTGDLGFVDPDGYLWLTGRTKRIAKLFGTRVDLDDVEGLFAGEAPAAAVAGDGDWIDVHFDAGLPGGPESGVLDAVRRAAAKRMGVPAGALRLVAHPEGLPRTASGKVDYQKLAR
jgi:acyl-CoA synthetase (AMP-forming)/AMP-acid ligase II